mmetsp:Transcript_57192/g.113672  ORF Transcript_57192/g.113672 Transcript_57192/m.113672 type:complete len:957 (-) Transcript_57192:239-3109(-)
MGYDMSTAFMIHIEMPAIEVCSQVSFDVRPSRLQDVFDGAVGLVNGIAHEYGHDLIDLDHECTEQKLETIRRKAMLGVNLWQERLKMADEWEKKFDGARETMNSMRDAYYRELLFLREQLYQKKKAAREDKPFEPSQAVLFDCSFFTMDQQDSMKVVQDKFSQLTKELTIKHDEIETRLRSQIIALKDQLSTEEMKLAMNERLLKKVMNRHGYKDEKHVMEVLGDVEGVEEKSLREQKQLRGRRQLEQAEGEQNNPETEKQSKRAEKPLLEQKQLEKAEGEQAVRNFRSFLERRFGSRHEAKAAVSQRFNLDANVSFANFKTVCGELGYAGPDIKALFVPLSGGLASAALGNILDQAFTVHGRKSSSDSSADPGQDHAAHKRSLRCIEGSGPKTSPQQVTRAIGSSSTGTMTSDIERCCRRSVTFHAAYGGGATKVDRSTMTLITVDSSLTAAFKGLPGSYDTARSSADLLCRDLDEECGSDKATLEEQHRQQSDKKQQQQQQQQTRPAHQASQQSDRRPMSRASPREGGWQIQRRDMEKPTLPMVPWRLLAGDLPDLSVLPTASTGNTSNRLLFVTRSKDRRATAMPRLGAVQFKDDEIDEPTTPRLTPRGAQSPSQGQPQAHGPPGNQPKNQTRNPFRGPGLGVQGQSCNAPGEEDLTNSTRSDGLVMAQERQRRHSEPLARLLMERARRDAEEKSLQGSSAGSDDEAQANADSAKDGSPVLQPPSGERPAGWACSVVACNPAECSIAGSAAAGDTTQQPVPMAKQELKGSTGEGKPETSRSGRLRKLLQHQHQHQHQHNQPRPQTTEPVILVRSCSSPRPGSEALTCAPDQFLSIPMTSRYLATDATRGKGSRASQNLAKLHVEESYAELGGALLDPAGAQLPADFGPTPQARRTSKRLNSRRALEVSTIGDLVSTSRHPSPMPKPNSPSFTAIGTKTSSLQGQQGCLGAEAC